MLCKLDVKKAFDRVNRNFLILLLEHCGFFGKVEAVSLSTVRFSILINGSPFDFFGSSRELKQGHSKSPLLFVIVMGTLGRMLDKTVVEGHTSSFNVGNQEEHSLVLSHLLFANDTLVLCDVDLDQLILLCMVLI